MCFVKRFKKFKKKFIIIFYKSILSEDWFYFSKNSLKHDTGEGHPENKYRIQSIFERLKKQKITNLEWSEPSKFDESLLKKTHENNYIDQVKKAFPSKGQFF